MSGPATHSQSVCADCGQLLTADHQGAVCSACLWDDPAHTVPQVTPGALLLHIPGHDVEAEIARGGMGIVYRALEREAGRHVALKMLLPHLAGEPGMRERFRLEARAVAGLDHPAVLPVFHIGEADGVPYFTMKLAEGGSLADRLEGTEGTGARSLPSIKSNASLSPRAAAALMADLADAVQFAHHHGVLHRDLKPGNVLFDDQSRPYLSDFGLVKIVDSDSQLTRSRHFLGTPHYAAPEVAAASASEATTASDVWSLGAMLYELLAGHLPFEASGVPALLRKIVDEPAPALPPGVPRDPAVICLKCLEKNPRQRLASAGELAAELRRWLDGRPIQSRSVSGPERLWRWALRHPATAFLTTSLLAALTFLTVSLLRESRANAAALLVSRNAEKSSRESEASSLLAEASAIRRAHDITRRDDAIAAVRHSAALRPGASARDELASLLALPAISSHAALPYTRWTPRPDANLERYVTLDKGGCSIRNMNQQNEIARIPRLPLPHYPPGPLSPDGSLLALRVAEGTEIWNIARTTNLITLPIWTGTISFPDNNALVTLSPDIHQRGPSLLCDLRTSPPTVRQVETLPEGWSLRALSPDGTLAVATQDSRAPGMKLIDTTSLNIVRDYAAEQTGTVMNVLWNKDSRSLFTGSLNGTISRWELNAPQPLWSFPAHEGRVFAIVLTHHGRGMATQGNDGQLKFWDLITLTPRGSLPWPGIIAHSSRDGSVLLAHRKDLSESRILTCTPSSVCEMSALPSTWAGNVNFPGKPHVFAAPDNSGFTVTGGHHLHFITANDARIRLTMATGVIDACAPDVIAGTGFIRTKIALSVLPPPPGKPIPLATVADGARLAFDPNRRCLLSGSPGGIRAWSIPAGSDVVNSLDRFSQLVVGVSGKPGLRLAQSVVKSFAPVELKAASLGLDMAASTKAITWSPNGRYIAWAGTARDKTTGIWIVDTGNPANPLALPNGGTVRQLTFTHDGTACLAATSEELICYDSTTGSVRWRIPHQNSRSGPLPLAAAANSPRLAAALTSDSISLLDPASGAILLTLTHPVTRTIRAFDISPDGTRLCALAGTLLQVWKLDTLDETLAAFQLSR